MNTDICPPELAEFGFPPLVLFALLLEAAAAPDDDAACNFSAPDVMVIGESKTSVGSKVVVEAPWKLASLPPKDSTHTALGPACACRRERVTLPTAVGIPRPEGVCVAVMR